MRRILSVFLVFGILLGVSVVSVEPVSTASESRSSTGATVTGPVVARVYFTGDADLAQLARDLDIWEVHRIEGYVVAQLHPDQYLALLAAGYRIEIDKDKTARLDQPLMPLPGQTEAIPSYPCYRTVEETYATAQAIVTAHPNLATWIDVGDSWEKTQNPNNGYDMRVLRLTNAAIPGPKPKFFAMSAIHAREYATAELNTRFAEYLANNYGIDPDVTWLLDYQEIHLMLQSNPDGRKRAETGLSWRKNTNNNYCANTNDRGADLNRNYDFQWGCCGGSSGTQCAETYRGPLAASEPETQAVENYVIAEFPDQRPDDLTTPAPVTSTGVFMDLHSYSELVLWPWGFTTSVAPNSTALQTLGRKFAYFNGYTPEQSVGLYPTDGTTDDFAYGRLGVPAYTIEMGTNFFQDCPTFENTILPGNLPALLYAAKASRRPYQTPAGPDSLQVTTTITSVVAGMPITLTALANDTRYGGSGEPTQNIVAARFTVDAPSWITGVISYPMAAADGVFNSPVEAVVATVNTSGWSLGRHTLFVESQDAAGNWGVPSAVFVWVTAYPDSAIAGTVRSVPGGAPLGGATVSLTGGALGQQLTTGPDGHYAFSVFSGTYVLTATAPYHYPTVLSPVVASSGMTTTQDITLTAIPSGTLTGVVQEAVTGFPLPATLRAVSALSTYQTTADPATGFYRLTVLSDTYTVTARAPSHVPVTQDHVTVMGQQTTTLNFALPITTCVLLVDDDGGRSYESYFQAALQQAGVTYHTWNVNSQGSPQVASMTPYAAVLWFTGDDSAFSTLTAQDRANLTTFLEGGGNLLINGTEIGAGNQSQPFYTDQLYTQFITDDSGVKSLVGGGPFAGLNLTLNGGDGANNQTWPDAIAPRGSARMVFTYTNGLGGGVAVDTGTYRAINLGFGIEGVSQAADRAAVVRDGLTWLGCSPLPHEWEIGKTAFASTVWAGERLTYTLSLTHTGLITATNVLVTDTLPLYTTFAEVSGNGSLTANLVTWSFPEVAPAQTLHLSLAVTVSSVLSGTPLVNAAYGVRSDQTPSPVWGLPVTVTAFATACTPVGQADQSYSPAKPQVGETVVFTGSVTPPDVTWPVTFTWSFGDGAAGTGSPVTHLFPLTTTARTYTVTLTAANGCGQAVASKTIMIEPMAVYLPVLIKNTAP